MTSALPIGSYYPDATSIQLPSDVAVIVPTLLRPSLADAIESVYRQSFDGRLQILVGVDKEEGDRSMLEEVLARRPSNVSAVVMTLPYSTSALHGGIHWARDGGALRAILTFTANSRHAAYLDDDNTWTADHVASLRAAVEGHAWAGCQRMLVDDDTGEDICIDRWDSVGVGRGRLAGHGGFVDPNCLMVDKVRTCGAIGLWATTGRKGTGPGDRRFFRSIARASHAFVERPTVRYRIRKTNVLWRFHNEGAEF